MNILLLSTSYFPEHNGASLRVEGLCKGLKALGHHVVVMAPGPSFMKEHFAHCVVYRIPLHRHLFSAIFESFTKFHISRYFAFKHYLPRIIMDEHIEIIHTRQPLDLFALGSYVKKHFGLRWITEAHKFLSRTEYDTGQRSFLSYKFLLFFEKFFLNKSDGVVALSSSGKDRLYHEGIHVPLAVVENASHPPHKKHQCVKTKNLVYAGTLREIEGLDVLLDAFALIHTSYPDVKLYLVGGGKKDWLEKKAQHLGISSHVIFTGEVEHERVFDYLASAYLFVYPRKDVPYHHDIIGLKIYDAFDIHLPLVTSDVGELGSLVTTHRLGLVCKPEDPHDFARQVAKLLDDRKLYASLVSHLKHYQQRHTWKSVCSHLLPLYPRHTTMRTPKNL